MAFKAINNSAGPDSLILILLVFSAYPQMTENNTPSASVAQRAAAVKKAMAEIQKIRAKHQVFNALNTCNDLSTTGIHNLALNSQVLL